MSDDIRFYRDQIKVFQAISRLLERSISPGHVLEETLWLIDNLLRADGSSIVIHDEQQTDQLVFRTVSGGMKGMLEGQRMPVNQGIVGWVIRNGKPLNISNPEEDPRFYRKMDESIGYQTENVLCVPLKLKNRTIGAIELINKRDRPGFTDEDQKMVTAIAGQTAILLENVHLEDLEYLNKVIRSLNEAANLEKLLNIALQCGIELVPGAECGFFTLLDEENGEFELRATVELTPQELDRFSSGEPAEPFAASISIPIEQAGRVIGYLNLCHRTDPNAFDEQDVSRVSKLVPEINLAIERVRERERLKEMARKDQLTGLYNRHFFNEIIVRERNRSRRYKHPISLLLLDVDGFKQINDEFGHQMGDRVLKQVADLVQRQVRGVDMVIRYGGDEFLVMMPETDHDGAYQVATRLRERIATWQAEPGLGHLRPTLSLGFACWPWDDEREAQGVLAEADRQMYQDKHGNNVVS
ncbi:MAG: diguanylate cyclase [Candidatus Bipolaricaulia bacterium]